MQGGCTGALGTENSLEPRPEWEPLPGVPDGATCPQPQLLLEACGESGGQLGWDALQREVLSYL